MRCTTAPVDEWPGAPEDAEPAMHGKGPAFIQNNFEILRAQEQRAPARPWCVAGRG